MNRRVRERVVGVDEEEPEDMASAHGCGVRTRSSCRCFAAVCCFAGAVINLSIAGSHKVKLHGRADGRSRQRHCTATRVGARRPELRG